MSDKYEAIKLALEEARRNYNWPLVEILQRDLKQAELDAKRDINYLEYVYDRTGEIVSKATLHAFIDHGFDSIVDEYMKRYYPYPHLEDRRLVEHKVRKYLLDEIQKLLQTLPKSEWILGGPEY